MRNVILFIAEGILSFILSIYIFAPVLLTIGGISLFIVYVVQRFIWGALIALAVGILGFYWWTYMMRGGSDEQ